MRNIVLYLLIGFSLCSCQKFREKQWIKHNMPSIVKTSQTYTICLNFGREYLYLQTDQTQSTINSAKENVNLLFQKNSLLSLFVKRPDLNFDAAEDDYALFYETCLSEYNNICKNEMKHFAPDVDVYQIQNLKSLKKYDIKVNHRRKLMTELSNSDLLDTLDVKSGKKDFTDAKITLLAQSYANAIANAIHFDSINSTIPIPKISKIERVSDKGSWRVVFKDAGEFFVKLTKSSKGFSYELSEKSK